MVGVGTESATTVVFHAGEDCFGLAGKVENGPSWVERLLGGRPRNYVCHQHWNGELPKQQEDNVSGPRAESLAQPHFLGPSFG